MCIIYILSRVTYSLYKKSKISDESRNKHQKQNNVHLVLSDGVPFDKKDVLYSILTRVLIICNQENNILNVNTPYMIHPVRCCCTLKWNREDVMGVQSNFCLFCQQAMFSYISCSCIINEHLHFMIYISI